MGAPPASAPLEGSLASQLDERRASSRDRPRSAEIGRAQPRSSSLSSSRSAAGAAACVRPHDVQRLPHRPRRRLRLTPQLQPAEQNGSPASGWSRVFGMGDVASLPAGELQLGHTAELNAHVAAENMRRSAAGR